MAPLAHGRYRAKLKAAMKSTVKERAAKAANEAAHKLHLDDAASALQHKQRALIRGSQRAASRSRDMVATAMPLNPRLGLNRNRVAPLPMPIRADSMTLTDLTAEVCDSPRPVGTAHCFLWKPLDVKVVRDLREATRKDGRWI